MVVAPAAVVVAAVVTVVDPPVVVDPAAVVVEPPEVDVVDCVVGSSSPWSAQSSRWCSSAQSWRWSSCSSAVVVVSPPVVDEPPVVVVVGCVVLVVEVRSRRGRRGGAGRRLHVVDHDGTVLVRTRPARLRQRLRDRTHRDVSARGLQVRAATTACGVAALPASTSTLMSTFGLSPVFTSET